MSPVILANMTLQSPPPGTISNFDNPPTERAEGEVTMVICMVLGAIFIALRIYTKVFITKMYGWDDCMRS